MSRIYRIWWVRHDKADFLKEWPERSAMASFCSARGWAWPGQKEGLVGRFVINVVVQIGRTADQHAINRLRQGSAETDANDVAEGDRTQYCRSYQHVAIVRLPLRRPHVRVGRYSMND
ncbi:hypothetical protein [Paracoccus sp. PAR01]|uniref:hypothetical protein n=1 Tax=Paracoccus sp. PAR01 TaxID=2769282 RepID=UPI0017810471|nr:hypothetical protein [Paracoccus sp. PAR01]MBD9529356.1 hypothetical protein [Paracoccus sp. PAR01]